MRAPSSRSATPALALTSRRASSTAKGSAIRSRIAVAISRPSSAGASLLKTANSSPPESYAAQKVAIPRASQTQLDPLRTPRTVSKPAIIATSSRSATVYAAPTITAAESPRAPEWSELRPAASATAAPAAPMAPSSQSALGKEPVSRRANQTTAPATPSPTAESARPIRPALVRGAGTGSDPRFAGLTPRWRAGSPVAIRMLRAFAA